MPFKLRPIILLLAFALLIQNTVPKTIHTFQLDPIKSARPVLADFYKDALPDELPRPPRA